MFCKFHPIGLFFMLAAFGPQLAAAQLKAVPISELTDSMHLHPKPALILISTDWCAYCRMQRAQLEKSRTLQAALPDMYFSEFDAETEHDVVFKIGRAHVCTPVTNAHLVCRLILEKK